jgi:hypothetical protein
VRSRKRRRGALVRRQRSGAPWWAGLSDEELLDLRFCDLGLRIPGTELEARREQLYAELAERGLTFRPHCWLSYEWFSPVGIPGFAIPFYLAHRRLARLEDRMMLEVEGGTKRWCMQLMRHETGHAYETAYRLNRRARWRKLFGRSSKPYPEYYNPRPFSRSHVLHLEWWYAQSHPSEDFAETFAVWLTPGSDWRKRYKGWTALRKLEYVDELMTEIAGTRPTLRSRAHEQPVSQLRTTLREHYKRRQRKYGTDYPDFYKRDLAKVFSASPDRKDLPAASSFLRRIGPELRNVVANWTGEHPYTVGQVLKEMRLCCRELGLRVDRPAEEAKLQLAVLLTMQTTSFIHSGDHRCAL